MLAATMDLPLHVAPDVAAALAAGAPVVALESTLVAHGMPWPRNAQTALAVEAEVRAHGATPATIAILDGQLKVGLTAAEVERVAHAGAGLAKASRRDIGWLVASGGSGATTVAATMIIAALAGVRVFATGGIGGVHRGASASFDVSADLQELARTPVAVVCAGAKAILDLALTLEYLETHGVPVIGWRTDRLPAFYSVDSGLALDHRADDTAQIAAAMRAHWALGGGGIVVANPIPPEHALPGAVVDAAIGQALAEARAQGVVGKALTPLLLARVNELSGGDSLAANIALVLNNARLAAAIAAAFAAAS
jgi:pseudouridylate synthase